MKSAKNILLWSLVIGSLLISGCAGQYESKLIIGAGQHGSQAANNMAVGSRAGDHSTGNGSGFIEDDCLSGVVRAFKGKQVRD